MEAGWVRRHGGAGVAPDPPAPTGRDGPSQHPSESTSPPKKSELNVQRVIWGHPNRRRTLPHFQHLAENRNRGRPNDATNARLVPGEPPGRYVGTLLSSLEPAQRFQPRIKRYPQHHTVRGMDSELWRRRHRPIPSVRHVLTTAPLISHTHVIPASETCSK